MIRAAEEEDAKDLALLAAKFFGQEQLEGTGLKIDGGSTERYMQEYCNLESSIFLVAIENGEIVGSVAGMIVPWMFNARQLISHELWWFVLPEHRGTSGARLIKAFYRESKRRGATAVVVATSGNKEESRVVDHYYRTGFKHLEHHFIKGV